MAQQIASSALLSIRMNDVVNDWKLVGWIDNLLSPGKPSSSQVMKKRLAQAICASRLNHIVCMESNRAISVDANRTACQINRTRVLTQSEI